MSENTSCTKIRTGALLLGAAACMWVIQSSANPISQPPAQLREIVVTAQKRKQSEEDVAMSLAALTRQDLAKLNIHTTREIGVTVPNVQVNYGAGMVSYNIRGIGVNFFATNLDPPVATYVDGVYLSKTYMSVFAPFDIARVEVLKGPQGTLNGSNTTGGSVNFYTRKPTRVFHAGLSLGYGNYRNRRIEGYISGPLLGEKLTGRIAGFYHDQGAGYYWNTVRNTSQGMPDLGAMRAELQWRSGGTTALAEFNFGRDRSNRAPYQGVGIVTPASLAAGHPQFCPQYLNGTVTGATADCVRATDGRNPGTANPFLSQAIVPNLANNTAVGGSLRLEQAIGRATFESLTAYQTFVRAEQEDSDGSPLYTVDVYWYQNFDQFTQELRWISADESWGNYVIGAFYEHDHLTNGDYLTVAHGKSPGYYSPFEQRVDAAAAYAHSQVNIARGFAAVLGARFDSERTTIDGGTYAATGLRTQGVRTMPTAILVPLAVSSALPNHGRRTDKNVSWKAGFQWSGKRMPDFFNHVLLYADAETGFRSGGFNADFAALQQAFTTLSPEKILEYEAGFKTILARDSMSINGSIFHYDYHNAFINVDSATAPIPITLNAGVIRANGAELDVHWRPLAGLDLSATGGWLDSIIKSHITSSGIDIYGDSPVNAPKATASGQVSYDFPITENVDALLSTDVNWRSGQYLYVPNDPANYERPYAIWNAIATLNGGNGRWSVSLWGHNLSNTQYRTYVNDLRGFGWLLNVWGRPRTYGVTVHLKY